MAEFCLDCWNKMNDSHLTAKDVVLSEDLDLCEGCASFKPVIIKCKKPCIFKRICDLSLCVKAPRKPRDR